MANETWPDIARRALDAPDDVRAQIAAAYHCDAHRTEEEAIVYYDRAAKLGVPEDAQPGFSIGYGSTLKNVGRVQESAAVLKEAARVHATNRAIQAFLALTQLASADANGAVATLLRTLLSLKAHDDEVNAYARALESYTEELETASRVHRSALCAGPDDPSS
ncbi:MAG: tetratricopeptide repeat protein [Myxococcota bacterium]